MAINTVSINFNNASGLLSSATAYDLWKMSVKNGSQQTWNEFCGFSKAVSPLVGAPNTSSGVGVNIPTTGSLLVINPAMDLSLPVEFSAGSQGNYNLQMIFSASNQFQYQIQPEIVIMTMLSGVVVTQQGVSQLYTSLLTKDLVLKTKEDKSTPQIDSVQYQRLVGGKLGNRASSAVHKMLKHATRKMEGSAMSAGELSGAAESGGAMRKNRKLSSLLK